jgi:hypothetical protein
MTFMETTAPHIPRFRTTARLSQWVRRNRPAGRLPPESERCFFRSKEQPEKVSSNLLYYSNWGGLLGEDLDALLVPDDLVGYCRIVHTKGLKVPSSVFSRMDETRLVLASQFLGRLPEEHERRILQPNLASVYAGRVGPVPSYLEDVIVESADSAMDYIEVLKVNFKEVPDRFMRALVGHDRHFLRLARALGGRIPSYLEESMTDPNVALNYARNHVRGRLPESVEGSVFFPHPRMAVKYAFEIIRGFSNPTLPDSLHNSVVLSVEASGDSEVRRYIAEVERFSEKPLAGGE